MRKRIEMKEALRVKENNKRESMINKLVEDRYSDIQDSKNKKVLDSYRDTALEELRKSSSELFSSNGQVKELYVNSFEKLIKQAVKQMIRKNIDFAQPVLNKSTKNTRAEFKEVLKSLKHPKKSIN